MGCLSQCIVLLCGVRCISLLSCSNTQSPNLRGSQQQVSPLHGMAVAVNWLLWFCSKCLLFSGISKRAELSWDMLFLWQRENRELIKNVVLLSVWLKLGHYHFCLHFICSDRSHTAKPDNVAEQYTPPIEKHYKSPGNGLGCAITLQGREPMWGTIT